MYGEDPKVYPLYERRQFDKPFPAVAISIDRHISARGARNKKSACAKIPHTLMLAVRLSSNMLCTPRNC